MSDTFRCDDKDMLVAYLYGEIDLDGRREVDRHLRACDACAAEVEGLRAVRSDLASWEPPETDLGFVLTQKPPAVLRPARWAALGQLPVWAQVAAAALVLGVGAAVANLQVRYGIDGLHVSTGWMSTAPSASVAASTAGEAGLDASSAAWRPELAALEQTLRAEMRQRLASTGAATAASPARADAAGDETAAILRRVQTMLEASERRQREEMAYRLAQTTRDWNTQRVGDLMRIQQDLGSLQGRTMKAEVGQREVVNLLRRVATQPIP